MRRLLPIVLMCVGVAAIATLRSVSADNSMMTNSMMSMPKSHQYLLGTWNCDVKLAAMQGQPARTDHGVMTIAMSPSMTMHSHVAAKDYMSDTYEGFDVKSKMHWLNTSDTTGGSAVEMSKDGVIFTGTAWQGGMGTPVRDTQTKISDSKLSDTTELKMNGKWSPIAVAVCTKQ